MTKTEYDAATNYLTKLEAAFPGFLFFWTMGNTETKTDFDAWVRRHREQILKSLVGTRGPDQLVNDVVELMP